MQRVDVLSRQLTAAAAVSGAPEATNIDGFTVTLPEHLEAEGGWHVRRCVRWCGRAEPLR